MAREMDHFIVGIGASAGGLEAINEFFDNMPASPDCSFVVIQHLSPDHKSLLAEIITRHTKMRVYEAVDGVRVEPNCVYIIPSNKALTIRGNNLTVEKKEPLKVPNNAIDVFLQSLAREWKEKSIGVILSGTGSDGTKGIEAIKACGGLVLVQDPKTAQFDGMPISAIQSGHARAILSPSQMPEEILFHTQTSLSYLNTNNLLENKALDEIFQLIHDEVGFNFHYYKTPTLLRRIYNRISKGNHGTLESYLEVLRKSPQECRALSNDFLIGVTKFFRDKETFQVLAREVINPLVASKENGDILKVWVVACSTGEEAISIAILINEALEKQKKDLMVKIFATDIDERSITIANKGIYPTSIEADISKEILEKYFSRSNNSYQILPHIRKQIIFVKHDITNEAPFVKNDLVSCRNMLIYMTRSLQEKLFPILLYALKRQSYLFLGSSESPVTIEKYLVDIDAKAKIYRKEYEAPLNSRHLMDISQRKSSYPEPEGAVGGRGGDSYAKFFQQEISREFGYVGCYINDEFEIVKTVGDYNDILSLPQRELVFNLLEMLPPNLGPMLSLEVRKVWKTNQRVLLRDLKFQRDDDEYVLEVLIVPAKVEVPTRLTLVILRQQQTLPGMMLPPVVPDLDSTDKFTSDYIRSLEMDLQKVRYNLQVTVENTETINEELQSSNEELLTANEELQSSNEELQSVNEELHTLNTEYQLRIQELSELNDDMNNYFRSSDFGQIFLDKDLNIRKFNPASAKMINLIESDIGRSITHFSTNFRYENLVQELQTVQQTNQTIERELLLANGRNLLMRMLPYLSNEDKQAGIVISFVDVSLVKHLSTFIGAVFNVSPSAILAMKSVRSVEQNILDFVVETSNYMAGSLLGTTEDLKGKSVRKDLPQLVSDELFQEMQYVVERNVPMQQDFYLLHTRRWYQVNAIRMEEGLVMTFADITQKKVAEDKLRNSYAELVRAKDSLKELNTDLENKVRERTLELSKSEERFKTIATTTIDAIWEWDFVRNEAWWSDTFYNVFGYDVVRDKFTRATWAERIHPDDKDRVQKTLYRAINQNSQRWSTEYRFQRADGQYLDILDQATIIKDELGAPCRMIGSMLDITQLKQAEQAIANSQAERKFLAESMPLIVWMTDETGNITFVNRQFEKYTGLLTEEILAKGWSTVIHPQHIDVFLETWRQSVNRAEEFTLELRLLVQGGDYHWNLLRANPRKNRAGVIVNWVITSVDIHEQKSLNKLLEEKVASRTRELEEVNEALRLSNNDLKQFASVASHDLQEPIRKMVMFSRMVGTQFRDQLPEKAHFYLDAIASSSERMRAMITNILNFSKISPDRGDFRVTDINAMLRDIQDDYELLIKEREALITIDPFPEIEVIPNLIRQVFQNLISNALKFARDGVPPQITITATRVAEKSFAAATDPDGPFCRCTFRDNGIGFNEEFREKIFVLFHRINPKDKYEGSGIGLAIVKKVIDIHQGLVRGSGEDGQGALFELVIPIKQ